MWLEIGDVAIPPVSHAFAVDACRHAEGLQGIASESWWPGYDFVPLYWYAGIVLPRYNASATGSMVGNVVEGEPDPKKESHVIITGTTAKLLDAEFAKSTAPTVILRDGEVQITLGAAFMHSKILLRAAANSDESLWLYEFLFHTTDGYRVNIVRRHAGPWLDVMLSDTYPREGSPPTGGPTLYEIGEETTYTYADDAGEGVVSPVYAGSFDVQFDSGCRYGQTLKPVATKRGANEWERDTPRFWTLAEAKRVAEEEWAKYSDRLIFGGRIPVDEMAANMPVTFTATYSIIDPPSDGELSVATNVRNASGDEGIDLGDVAGVGNLAVQLEAFAEWELNRRRLFQAVFSGLVPWRMTPFDSGVEWRLPIDGIQKPVTIVLGVESRSWDQPSATVANPAPAGGQITVTFTRPAFPMTGNDTPPAGQLTRTGYGSSEPFVPPPMTGTTASYVYDSLADGEYTVAPGSPWTPTTLTVNVTNGSSETMDFNR